jgi:hypothetical protein
MRLVKTLAAAVALFVGVHAAQSAEPAKIRMGWVVAPGSVATLLAMKPDLSVHRDKTYSFEPIHFVSTAVELVPRRADNSTSSISLIRRSAPRSRMHN